MSLKIGIIGAMDTEVQHLKDQLTDSAATTIAGMEFCEGLLGGVPVVVVRSGIGKVNAAACTQILASHFGVTHLVNTGAAGSLDARIDINDIVVSTDALHHDVDATNFGYELGQVPQMKVVSYEADPALRAMAVRAVEEAAPDVRAFEGRVLSGDQFVRDDAVKQRIKDAFGGLCVEMEGAAIAQAAYINGVPFVIVRAISDKADGSDAEDYQTFEDRAAEHCAHIVEYMVAHLEA